MDHMPIICTLLQTDRHARTSPLIFTGRMLFLTPNQQCQSTEGKVIRMTTGQENQRQIRDKSGKW